ncbi:hypothetical protein [Bacillus badius]|uniref:hypothetical protein n=1 Tax=Bacillus badius TaxID=1455 RepID=UPI000597D773|nr:hypothetical protein [Bacillus badius]MED4716727.1 hypothetical protein [Bacillus badius]
MMHKEKPAVVAGFFLLYGSVKEYRWFVYRFHCRRTLSVEVAAFALLGEQLTNQSSIMAEPIAKRRMLNG